MPLYFWIKALHFVGIVAWFAGLFYIFRLFVYHVREKDKDAVTRVFSEMESKLLRIITVPAGVFVLLTGSLLAWLMPGVLSKEWFWIKMIGVLVLHAYQALAIHVHRRFSRADYFLSERACRMLNELPTLCLLLNVAMAVLKPWGSTAI